MAEFITFTRSDVTVFMRRGQFYDKPDLPISRRKAGSEGDMFPSNDTADYDNPKGAQSKSLADMWLKSQDTRKYAEKLTKYSPVKISEPPSLLSEENSLELERQHQKDHGHVISVDNNPLVPTETWRGGASDIIMRNFKPLQEEKDKDSEIIKIPNVLFPSTKAQIFTSGRKQKLKGLDGTKLRTEDSQYSFFPTRRPIKPADTEDYTTEEVDEDNIVYKPV